MGLTRFSIEPLLTYAARFRWLLLVFIAAGHLFLLGPSVANLSPAIHVAGLITLIATALLLTRLDGSLGRNLWAWLILFVFLVGYYGKLYALSRFVGTPAMAGINPEWTWVTPAVVGESYYWTTLAYVIFCSVAWVSLGRQSNPKLNELGAKTVAPPLIAWIISAAAAVGVVSTLIQWQLGIGIMGVAYTRLPVHLDTLIFRARGDLVPALLLLSVWAADMAGRRRLFYFAVGSLVVLAFFGAIVTTSRGEIFFAAMSLAFLWILISKANIQRLGFLALVVAVAFVMIPIISNLRAVAMHQTIPPTASAPSGSIGALNSVGKGLIFATLRVSGTDGVWYASRNLPTLLTVTRFSHLAVDQLPVWYSREIVGVKAKDDFREPGLIGAFMLLGGLPGLVILLSAYVYAISRAWRFSATRLRTAPVALTLLAGFLLKFTMSGTLFYQEVVAVVVTMAACEILLRKGTMSAGLEPNTPTEPLPLSARAPSR